MKVKYTVLTDEVLASMMLSGTIFLRKHSYNYNDASFHYDGLSLRIASLISLISLMILTRLFVPRSGATVKVNYTAKNAQVVPS